MSAAVLPAATGGRVLGWDLLRGCCAIAVASYHLLLWQGVATLNTFGSYGVYLFFVLSGASLAYNYVDRVGTPQFSLVQFLRVRYLRLAPLYILLMLVLLPWKLLKAGADGGSGELGGLLATYLANAGFVFGFYKPAEHAALIGGWSLGIEAIFYLLFPLFMLAFRQRGTAWLVFGVLLALQAAWIQFTLGRPGGYAQNAALYHHAPAFAAYFMGGCMLGVAQRRGRTGLAIGFGPALAVILAGFALMLALNPAQQGDELTGWRGVVLCLLCFVLAWASGQLALRARGRLAGISRYFGDATYGLYLLHPVLFFGLVYAVFPKLGIADPREWALIGRVGLAAAIIAAAFALALLSEKYIEMPIRRRSKRAAPGSAAAA